MVFAYPLHLIVRTKLQTNQLYKEHLKKYLSNLLQGPAFSSSGNWRHCRVSALLDRQSDTWGLFVGQSILLHFIILFIACSTLFFSFYALSFYPDVSLLPFFLLAYFSLIHFFLVAYILRQNFSSNIKITRWLHSILKWIIAINTRKK